MEYTVSCGGYNKRVSVQGDTQSDVFKDCGKIGMEMAFGEIQKSPSAVWMIKNPNGDEAAFTVIRRGTFAYNDDPNDVRYAPHIESGYNDLPLKGSEYPEKEMRCIMTAQYLTKAGNKKLGSYKRYHFFPDNVNGTCTQVRAGYNGIQESELRMVKEPYKPYMFWPLYYEKEIKGYKDVTDVINAEVKKRTKKAVVSKDKKKSHPDNEYLWKILSGDAQKVVQTTLVNNNITEGQCQKVRKEIVQLKRMKTVNGFNRHLREILILSPRKRVPLKDVVGDFFAKSKDDFQDIIVREVNLLLAMESNIGSQDSTDLLPSSGESFHDYNISVWEANDTQKKEVMDLLSPNLQSRVVKIWRVKPRKQEKRFADYCRKNNIKQIKKFWHGSVNGSWKSIILSSLRIMTSYANGRMFGDGVYLAKDAFKSLNYTSCKGSKWARGTSQTGFMGLYATAYGNPCFTTSSHKYTKASVKSAGYDCVHAQRSPFGLKADEIIFYDEDAVVLNYIVQFKSV